MVSNQQNLQHLYLRAAFGESPDTIQQKLKNTIEKNVEELFHNTLQYRNLSTMENPVKNGKEVTNLKILLMLLRSRDETLQMNLDWLDMMAQTNAGMREKMTFFWHGHFATATPFAWLMQVQNNTLRRHALGNFRTLLHAVAKDPAMIIYLNNHQNKKDAPNENFAREVMELFTLGEGVLYTEKDIKEAARAFTGWTVNKKGEYEFRDADHDFGTKEFLGQQGDFNGDDILDIILQQKQTARYITRKIYRNFVREETDAQDEGIISSLAEDFYSNGYDIKKLMKVIFTADWFYDEKNAGAKIASPVELIVRYKKLIAFDIKADNGMFYMQRLLGQTLFFPPNVAGWKGGKNWIDSTSLFLRMNIPRRILHDGGFDVRPKPEFEDVSNDDESMLKTKKRSAVQSDWSKLVSAFRKIPPQDLTRVIINTFIQAPKDDVDETLIAKYIDNSTTENRIISTCSAIFSLPEFQLI